MLNHFAKVCRRKLNTAQNTQQNNRITNIETAETTDQNSSQESQNVNNINYNEQINSDYDSSDDNYVATAENVNSPQAALKIILITIGNTDCDLLLDSGSSCTIINMSLAKEIMYSCPQSQWSEKKPLELKSFSNDIVKPLGTLKTPVRCNDWKIQKAKITFVADGFRPILGRDLLINMHNNIAENLPECRSQ